MSYSVSLVGTPAGLKVGLDRAVERLSGQSKEELEAVVPALKILIDQNYSETPIVFHLQANGHAYVKDGVKQYGNCAAHLTMVGTLEPE